MPRAYPPPTFDLLECANENLLHIEVSPTNHRAALNGPDSVRFEAESVSRVLAEQPQHA